MFQRLKRWWRGRKSQKFVDTDVGRWRFHLHSGGQSYLSADVFEGTYGDAQIEARERAEVTMFREMQQNIATGGDGVMMANYGVVPAGDYQPDTKPDDIKPVQSTNG